MVWRAKVTLTGPEGGRGVKFIFGGFVQVVNFTLFQGYYYPEQFPVESDMQGESYLDSGSGPPLQIGPPPYYSNSAAPDDGTFFGASGAVTTISAEDSPIAPMPLTYNGSVLDSVNHVWEFHDYVVAKTMDPRAGVDVYTSRADARWRFDWSSSVDHTAPFACHDIVAADTVIQGWAPVTDGSQPPHINDTEFANDYLLDHAYHRGD